ncbi:hypothetical protein [Allorhizocola rhizosphaerae]|uniref:hypothetical protein n=1 Tax=Allorhizocola rhizosphaerae TaxID=1872709 RepID=UPI0013C2EBF2|nr:hypothetical protein [Allorhizocola rhizosphaerae]
MDPIEQYLAELDRVLRGPRHVKADLLAEARDSLHDAMESYMDGGVAARPAGERAVADFGEIPVVAAGFQAELSRVQARRTALWLMLVVAAQPLVWGPLRPGGAASDPTAAQALIDRFIDTLGFVAMTGGLLALLACGIGVRLFGVRREVARITGVFTLTVAAGLVAMSSAMMAGVDGDQLWSPAGLPWALIFLVSPMAAVARSARRCLAAA